MGCRIRRIFSGLLLLGAIVWIVLLGMGWFNPPPAAAAIRQLEEASGQMVYQSWRSLKDQHGNVWRAIAFKQTQPDGTASFELRLVGFPGIVEIDRAQPLTLTNSMGKTFTADDDSSQIFVDPSRPEPHVAQYNLKPLLAQLPPEVPLKLTLPMVNSEPSTLSVPPALIQEWQTVANRWQQTNLTVQ